jgi:hypothetical protein
MSLREYILKDLNAIRNPKLLQQCFEYIQTIKKTERKHQIKIKY